MKDRQTLEYFDRMMPHYNPVRFEFAIAYLNKTTNGESSLIDIGCGDGATYTWSGKRRQLSAWWVWISAGVTYRRRKSWSGARL